MMGPEVALRSSLTGHVPSSPLKAQSTRTLLREVLSYIQKDNKKSRHKGGFFYYAPRVGFEPTTYRLTADRSTIELPRNIKFYLFAPLRQKTRRTNCISIASCKLVRLWRKLPRNIKFFI